MNSSTRQKLPVKIVGQPQTIRSGSIHKGSSHLSWRVSDSSSTPYGRDKVTFLNHFSIKATVCYEHPGSSASELSAPSAYLTLDPGKKRGITCWTFPFKKGQYHLRAASYSINTLSPEFESPSSSGKIIGTSHTFPETCRISTDKFLFYIEHLKKSFQKLIKVCLCNLPIGTTQGGMIWNPLELELLTNFICCKKPFFHVSVAKSHIEHHQNTGYKLRKGIPMRAFGVAVERKLFGNQMICNSGNFDISAFSNHLLLLRENVLGFCPPS